MLRHFDVDCLPTNYGGTVEIPEGTGVALGDLFRLYGKEFESKHHLEREKTNLPFCCIQNFIIFSFVSLFTVANSFGYDSAAGNSH